MRRSDDWITELHYKEYIKPKYEDGDFYWENGKIVMTEKYHQKRGYCCGSGCKHCAYWPPHQKTSTQLKTN
tara:strand:- start:417 stop:629 length:213 start_codon:yes stop_codon:yes gene_type:complete